MSEKRKDSLIGVVGLDLRREDFMKRKSRFRCLALMVQEDMKRVTKTEGWTIQ